MKRDKRLLGEALLLAVLLLAILLQFLFGANTGLSLGKHLGWQAYLYNFTFAVIATRVLLALAEKKISYLGFAFMGASLLKFTGFFIFFFPTYKESGSMEGVELATFFIPYAICLIYSSLSVFRALNRT